MMMSSRVQISCISVVTVMLMLMHVGCGTIKCGSTTALVMAVGFSLPSQVIKQPALVMQSNVM